ncbi:hypothetical protein PybrP1_011148 [[Pythium] brassicae (nom. inval.)]|nr:hypothetical protein PybrP1_011148 [[Pythium] brassicae (nom. inval.)]
MDAGGGGGFGNGDGGTPQQPAAKRARLSDGGSASSSPQLQPQQATGLVDFNSFVPSGYTQLTPPMMAMITANGDAAPTFQAAVAAASSPQASTPAAAEPCVICREKGGGVYTCRGGCGLHVHPACIGETLLFPHSAGLMCGNCFAMKQNRSSKENLQTGGANGLSVRRAVLFINLETNSQPNFDKFGHMASLRLLEIGEIAGYPIKPFAAKFVEPYLETPLSVREIFTLLVGLYGLKQACIAHGLKEKLVDLVKVRNFSTTDFLGWHPSIEGPQVKCSSLCQNCNIRNSPEVVTCTRCSRPLSFPSVFTKFASALLATYYAEQVEIPLGTTCLDVFAHTNTVRASYKGLKPYDTDGTEWEVFSDQMRTIFGILDVVSNFGVLELNPDLFEPELKVITTTSYLNHAMYLMDFEVVAKFLQSMRLFGAAKAAELANTIFVTERFLLIKQLQDGSWLKAGGSFADQYKATAVCAKALATPVFQGFGPASSDFHRLLEKWAKAVPNSKFPNLPSQKVLVSGVKVKPPTRANLKKLESFYKRQLAPDSEANALERLVTERLRKILPSKKAEPAKSEATRVTREADAASGATDSEDVKKEPSASTSTGATGTTEENDAESGAAAGGSEEDDDDDVGADAKEGGAQTEDDALTSMSLNEDLEIFDGLKFEGGGVIDVASARAPPRRIGSASEGEDDAADDGEGDVDADTDGAETVQPEDEEDEEMGEMYDDDDDENGDAQEEQVDDGGADGEPLDEPSSAGGLPDPDQMLGDVLSFAENVSGDFSLDM